MLMVPRHERAFPAVNYIPLHAPRLPGIVKAVRVVENGCRASAIVQKTREGRGTAGEGGKSNCWRGQI